MTAKLQEFQAVSKPPSVSKYWGLGALAVLGVVVLSWCQLFYQLLVEWTANAQYAYGWFVPLLAAVLLWRRWGERPESKAEIGKAESRNTQSFGTSGTTEDEREKQKAESRKLKAETPDGGRRTEDGGQWSVVSRQWSVIGGLWSVVRSPWSVVFLLFMLLPLRIIHEANVGWRSAQWLHALILVALTLMVLWRVGGSAWVRHFGFPVLFLLVAVPWPMRLEEYVVQRLMRLVAAVTVEVVGVFGVPAMQRGNLLEIGSGVVSVDGACSGVRSLQTSLMLALFLGEFYRLRYWGRLALIPASLLIAFVANVGRTSFLTWSAARLGMARMESLHGSAGVAVVVIVFGLLWLAARLMTTDHGPLSTDYRPQTTDLDSQPSTLNSEPSIPNSQLSTLNPKWLLAVLVWPVCIEAAAAVWFHIGDKRAETNQAWSINWPTGAPGYREAPPSKVASDMLRYDTEKNVAWQDEAGNRWSFIALRWGPDNKNSFIGRGHTPDICFTGAGWNLLSEPAPVRVTVNGIELPFRRYVFEVGGLTAYAFLALWDERSPGGRQETPFAYGIALRLKAAVEGKRHQGLKKLEISIIGPTSPEEALQVLQKGLEKLIITAKAEG